MCLTIDSASLFMSPFASTWNCARENQAISPIYFNPERSALPQMMLEARPGQPEPRRQVPDVIMLMSVKANGHRSGRGAATSFFMTMPTICRHDGTV
jgi:hypothetical protein